MGLGNQVLKRVAPKPVSHTFLEAAPSQKWKMKWPTGLCICKMNRRKRRERHLQTGLPHFPNSMWLSGCLTSQKLFPKLTPHQRRTFISLILVLVKPRKQRTVQIKSTYTFRKVHLVASRDSLVLVRESGSDSQVRGFREKLCNII